jgi:hypothetical protein
VDPRKIDPIRTALVAAGCALALAACDRSTPPQPTADAGKAAAVPITPTPQPQAAPAASETSAPAAKKADPDAELAAKVKSAFADDPELKMLPIDVRASNGAVTLYGTAQNNRVRDKAVKFAAKVEGVKSVNNNVQIVRGS